MSYMYQNQFDLLPNFVCSQHIKPKKLVLNTQQWSICLKNKYNVETDGLFWTFPKFDFKLLDDSQTFKTLRMRVLLPNVPNNKLTVTSNDEIVFQTDVVDKHMDIEIDYRKNYSFESLAMFPDNDHRVLGLYITSIEIIDLNGKIHPVSHEMLSNIDHSLIKNNDVFNSEPNSRCLKKLNDHVTFVFVDDLHVDECLSIIDYYEKMGITNIKWFTSLDIKNKYSIKIDPIISKNGYSYFILKELNGYIDTEFCLISQWDGFILDSNKWDDYFLSYDYIGAIWWWKNCQSPGGNGGFSLRSKKLMTLLENIPYNYDFPEDKFICEIHSKYLLSCGISFAPKNVSDLFSIEHGTYKNSFGFHDFTTVGITNARLVYKQKFYHSGDLGDIIYSLPFIKQCGGGILILSSDYSDMEIRSKMTVEKSEMIRQLLSGQKYIVDVRFSEKKPNDIDVDLNSFRKFFIDWGAGKLNHDETEKLKHTQLTQLYRLKHDLTIPIDFDSEPWLVFNEKTLIENRPIIINRTHRYWNDFFPWKSIVKDFGNSIMFVGTEQEHKTFSHEYGRVMYFPTKTFLDLTKILNGSRLFIGNQSFAYSLIEAMKKTSIQETNTVSVPNCLYVRSNAYLTYTTESVKYERIQQFIERNI